jgi:hypothetical protein
VSELSVDVTLHDALNENGNGLAIIVALFG